MQARIITGVILAIAFTAICLVGPTWLIYAMLQVATIIALIEIMLMSGQMGSLRNKGERGHSVVAALHTRTVGLVIGGGLSFTAFFFPHALHAMVLLCPVLVLGSFLIVPEPVETVAKRMSAALMVVFYVGLLFAALTYLSTHAFGTSSGRALLLLGAMVFLGDTGAFFMGKQLGNRKLYPAVSPGKTWMGALGGLLGSIVGALLFKLLVSSGFAWSDVLPLAISCSILAQIGDLTESLFKRSYGVKDSGGLLPGHGGVLDRMDGILFAAPYMLLYHALFGLNVG